MHWACTKITASLAIQDAPLLDILLDKVCASFVKLLNFDFNFNIMHFFLSVSFFLFPFSFCLTASSGMMFFDLQLKLCKGISYAAVAAHADKSGRRKLAAMLVEHEPRSSKQVFCFISCFICCFSYFDSFR